MSRIELLNLLSDLVVNQDWIIEDDTLYNLLSDLILELTPDDLE